MLKPLQGIKVVDFTLAGSGPSGTMILAELGADVIWVEPLEGNSCRSIHELSYYCAGKRSITLNLKSPEGLEAMYRLLKDADVFATNYRYKSVKKLGIGYEKVKELNPRIVYASMTGWGVEGPKAEAPGFDTVCFWARGGLLQDIAEKGTLVVPPVAIADIFTGEAMAFAIMTGLFNREKTGEGCELNMSILQQAIFGNHDAIIETQYGEKYPKSRLSPRRALLNTYQCSDGKWFVLLTTYFEKHFNKILEIIGREDLIGDPRWQRIEDTMYDRAPEFVNILDEGFRKMTRDEVLAKLTAADIACEAIQTTTDLFNDPQVLANGYLRPWTNPRNGKEYLYPTMMPFQFNEDVSAPPIGKAPMLGENSVEILKEYGYSDEEIQKLLDNGVTRVTDTDFISEIDCDTHIDYRKK